MADTILTNIDDSLTERVNSYLYVHNAFTRLKADKQRMSDKEWANSIGTPEEVKQAYQVIQDSLTMATKQIKPSELEQAQELGLMTDKQAKSFLVDKNLQALRKNDHHSHSHKQR